MKQIYVDSSWQNITRKPIFSLIEYLPKQLCKDIIDQWPYGNQERHETEIGWSAKYFTSVIDLDSQLNSLVDSYLKSAWEQSIEYYNIDIDVYEPYEVKKYVVGDTISDHVDLFYGLKPNERKLTMVVQLSESNDYAGGDLTVAPMQVADRTIGSVTVFPSFHSHAVKEITSGTRWSLNCWAWGNFWK